MGGVEKAALGLFAVVVSVVLLVGVMHVLHGPVTATSLHVSVEDAAETWHVDGDGCTRMPAGRQWRCHVSDRSGSGAARYVVDVSSSSSCWRGRLVGRGFEGEMPAKVRGCVTRWQPSLRSLFS